MRRPSASTSAAKPHSPNSAPSASMVDRTVIFSARTLPESAPALNAKHEAITHNPNHEKARRMKEIESTPSTEASFSRAVAEHAHCKDTASDRPQSVTH